MNQSCIFCHQPDLPIIAQDERCFAMMDRFPVTPYHCLIIPHRHVASFQNMSPEEWMAVHQFAKQLTSLLKEKDPTIDGFNLGINDGEAAGQTIFHAHVHWIPRRRGDCANPRGGVRNVIPGKADYLK